VTAIDARAVKHGLYGRHPGSGGQMPGPWTCIEEWRGIDFLAFSAWSSVEKYARVGYEVKVSRSDMRSELLNPGKRQANVEWCNSFYFALPKGLLTAEELAFEEPEWAPEDWRGERCPGLSGVQCAPHRWRQKKHVVRVPVPTTERYGGQWDHIACPTCNGRGATTKSRVERDAPTLWIPADVGLVEVDGRGTRIVKKSPRRTDVPALSVAELGQFVRWISMRPDPRHEARRSQRQFVTELVA